MNVGIDAIDFYLPKLSLTISELATARNIPPEKLEKGLGLKAMALTDIDEDAASMAANSLYQLIQNNEIDPHSIGRIYLGTESALDAAKPTVTYAIGAVEYKLENQFGIRCFKNCDVVDLTFACIGAIDALENCLDWIRLNPTRKAIVIASDIAKYNLKSSGEYTQGAGSVAMLITSNPGLLRLKEPIGVSMQHVGDFFKPRKKITIDEIQKKADGFDLKDIIDSEKDEIELFFEEPVFDGYYSNECYKTRIGEAMEHFNSKKNTDFLNEWDHLIFHLPYAFQGRRMILDFWINWIQSSSLIAQLEKEIGKQESSDPKEWKKAASKSTLYKKFIAEKIQDGEQASSHIGNMYTASIFMSLISLFTESIKNKKDISENVIGFLSYGSGSKSKVFEGIIVDSWKDKLNHLSINKSIEQRENIDFETYEKLHNSKIKDPLVSNDSIVLTGIDTQENKTGFRYYK